MNTARGLFPVREVLSITGIGIQETGRVAREAKFEIVVPGSSCRISPAGIRGQNLLMASPYFISHRRHNHT
jgi:hypothetical protein